MTNLWGVAGWFTSLGPEVAAVAVALLVSYLGWLKNRIDLLKRPTRDELAERIESEVERLGGGAPRDEIEAAITGLIEERHGR